MRFVQRENVVEMKYLLARAGIVSKQAHQSRVPAFVKMCADAGDQIHSGLDVNFIWLQAGQSLQPAAKPLLNVGNDWLKCGQRSHGGPAII